MDGAELALSRRPTSRLDAWSERTCRELLETAGIEVGGRRPFDLQVHDAAFYTRAVRDGMLGLGEGYMDGQWDCDAIDEMCARLLRAGIDHPIRPRWTHVLSALVARLTNLQARERAFTVGRVHYDLGNDLYEAMLDRRMVYTCAYWVDAANLDEAQERKLDLVCRKLALRPGMRVLDLGCGWGGFAGFAAERYGVEVIGYTVSREQAAWGKARYAHLPVELRLDDYRNATGTYDRVLSIGLLEHVGPKNHRAYMEVARRCLRQDGTAFIHAIGTNESTLEPPPWFHRYIFPNSVIPSLKQIARASEGLFLLDDVHEIGEHYDPTLMAWYANFEREWPALKGRYDERFRRMWRYYLLSCAGSFRVRHHQLYQIVMTPAGAPQRTERRTSPPDRQIPR